MYKHPTDALFSSHDSPSSPSGRSLGGAPAHHSHASLIAAAAAAAAEPASELQWVRGGRTGGAKGCAGSVVPRALMTAGAELAMERRQVTRLLCLSAGTGRKKKNHPIPSLAVNIKRTRRGEIAANGRLNQARGLETVKFNILLTFPLICATAPPLWLRRDLLFSSFFFWIGLAFRHHCV